MAAEFPDEVWQPYRQGDCTTRPDPRSTESTARARQQQPNGYAATEKEHAILVLDADAGNEAEPQPELLIPRLDHSYHNVGRRHPKGWLECVDCHQVKKQQICRGEQNRQYSNQLSEPSAAKLTCNKPGKPHGNGKGCGRQKTD